MYDPEPITEEKGILRYLWNELLKIAGAFRLIQDGQFDLKVYNSPPTRPREWQIAAADGTNWDPGNGQAYYAYIAGTWQPMAGAGAVNWASPGTIGSTTPNTGAFTTLTASGTTLIGTTSSLAGYGFEVKSDSIFYKDSGSVNLRFRSYSDAGAASNGSFIGQRARGTSSAPTAVQAGDRLLNFSGAGYDGTDFATASATVDLYAAENFTGSANGSYIAFITTSNGVTGASRTEKMRVDQDGAVLIGTTSNTSSYKLQVSGTSYLNGEVLVGGSTAAGSSGVRINSSTGLSGVNQYGVLSVPTFQTSCTNFGSALSTAPSTANNGSPYTIPILGGLYVQDATLGTNCTVTSYTGVYVGNLTKGGSNYAYYTNISSGSGKWAFFNAGTASSSLGGNLLLGTTTDPGTSRLRVIASTLTGVSQFGIETTPVGSSSATTSISGIYSAPQSAAASFTNSVTAGFWAGPIVKGSGSTITSACGVYVGDQTAGSNNFGVYSNVASGASSWNFYAAGTAKNYLNGNLLIGTTVDSGEKLTLNGNLVFPKTSGNGIKVDTSTPTYPWRDKEGLIYPDATAGPQRGTFITGVNAFAYSNGKQMDFSIHMPHDWAPGTDVYIHVHWGHNADTSVSGTVNFNFGITYAKGHDQANFGAAVSPAISYNLTNITTTPRYRHRIDEIQLSAASPSATQLDTDDLEPDGLIQGTMTVDLSGVTLTTTSPVNSIYVFTIDLHYQSTSIGTKGKVPNFYS